MSDSVQPHWWQPTRLLCPWDSPGKNTGVGCHFFLQCMLSCISRVRLCATPWTAAHQAPLSREFSSKNTGVGCHFLLPIAVNIYMLFIFEKYILVYKTMKISLWRKPKVWESSKAWWTKACQVMQCELAWTAVLSWLKNRGSHSKWVESSGLPPTIKGSLILEHVLNHSTGWIHYKGVVLGETGRVLIFRCVLFYIRGHINCGPFKAAYDVTQWEDQHSKGMEDLELDLRSENT